MAVAKVIEISSTSTVSFDDAIKVGIKKAGTTLHNVSGAWVQDQEVVVENSEVKEYRVRLRVTFVLD
ncbi:MAG: dodecin domain-containing protein [Fimbriimonadaceae bacterium]|nr:dodecin domain-containing protein [Fimbriimonadaceae bacterium]